MCNDPYMPITLEQLVEDTRARLERLDRELTRDKPVLEHEEVKEVKDGGLVLFESTNGVNW